METRLVVAFGLMAAIGVAAIVALAVHLPRRRREKLRRRGIKNY